MNESRLLRRKIITPVSPSPAAAWLFRGSFGSFRRIVAVSRLVEALRDRAGGPLRRQASCQRQTAYRCAWDGWSIKPFCSSTAAALGGFEQLGSLLAVFNRDLVEQDGVWFDRQVWRGHGQQSGETVLVC